MSDQPRNTEDDIQVPESSRFFHWGWARRMVEWHFDKLLVGGLIAISVGLACLGDILAVSGHWSFARNWVSREWLREQTALLIGALLGMLRGEHAVMHREEPKHKDG